MIHTATPLAQLVEAPLRRLAAFSGLEQDDLNILRAAAQGPTRFKRGANLMAARHDQLRFLGSGWACLTQRRGGDQAQIFCILVPGDPVDLSLLDPDRCAITALTAVEVVDFSSVIQPMAEGDPAFGRAAAAFECAGQASEQRVIDHMIRLGSRNAYEGLKHCFADLEQRLWEVGLAGPEGCPMPLGQHQLAMAFGMTTSHINRTLQQLRSDGVLQLSGEWLRLREEEQSTRRDR